jgi:stalled ribosome rescue protein Dom34
MKCFVVWIDRENAKVFEFSREKMERKTLKSHSPDHHTHRMDNKDSERIEKKLFLEVAEELSSDSQILILGPGVVKHHFQNYLNEHHPILSKRVVACETVDHPTDPQIAAQAMKFFKGT